jgi:hypothetical protein
MTALLHKIWMGCIPMQAKIPRCDRLIVGYCLTCNLAENNIISL